MALDQTELAQIVSAVISALRADGAASPKASSKPHFLAKGQRVAPNDLAAKDAQIVAAFKRRGFSVTLKDRANPHETKRRAKARARIAKLLAKQRGDLKRMPLSGKAALAAIKSGQ